MLWEKWGLHGDLSITDHDIRYWMNISTKMKYFDQIFIISSFIKTTPILHIEYFDYSTTTLRLCSDYSHTKITSRLLFPLSIRLFQLSDYSTQTRHIHRIWRLLPCSTTTILWLNYPQTVPLLRLIQYCQAQVRIPKVQSPKVKTKRTRADKIITWATTTTTTTPPPLNFLKPLP